MRRAYTLGVYEKAMPDSLSLGEKLAAAKAAGYDFLELSVDESEARLSRLDWTSAQRLALLRDMRETGLRAETMCLSAHRRFPLGSGNPALAARSLVILEKAVELAADLGIRIIQLAGYDVYYETSTAETARRFEENLRLCVEMAARAGVSLGFETMETPFMNTVAKAMRTVSAVGSPYLQIYPDVGNMTNGTDDVAADIACGAGHLLAAHLKETKPGVYRDLRYGEGRVDFPAAIAAFRAAGVRKFNAEFWYKPGEDWQTAIRTACDTLRGYMTEGGF